jgi:hypothetical protein
MWNRVCFGGIVKKVFMGATQSLPPVRVASFAVPQREIYPVGSKVWLENEDLLKQWNEQYTAWTEWHVNFEKLATKNVYTNDHLSDIDLRQHRSGIYSILAKGEELAASLYVLAYQGLIEEQQVPTFMNFIDSMISHYMRILAQWHAPIEMQDDLPKDLIEGFKDVDAARVVPLDKALRDPIG